MGLSAIQSIIQPAEFGWRAEFRYVWTLLKQGLKLNFIILYGYFPSTG